MHQISTAKIFSIVAFLLLIILLIQEDGVFAIDCTTYTACVGGNPENPYEDPPSCGDACDYSCQFADPRRCEAGDDSDLITDPGFYYNVKFYVIQDTDRNGNFSERGVDMVVSRLRSDGTRICSNPNQVWFSPNNAVRVTSGTIVGYIGNQAVVQDFQTGQRWDRGGMTVFRHPEIGPGVNARCDLEEYARTNLGFTASGDNRIFRIWLADTPLPGFQRYTIRLIRFSERNNRSINCQIYDGEILGAPRADARNIYFICNNPPPDESRRPTISILISNQDTIPQCMSSWCSPDPEAVPTVEYPRGSNQRISFGSALTSTIENGSRVRFRTNDASIIDFSANSTQEETTATPVFIGPYLFNYGSTVDAYVSSDVGSCGGTTTIRATLLRPDGSPMCECTTSQIRVACTAANPWYSVVGGDLIAVGGDIKSAIPTTTPTKHLLASSNLGMPIYSGSLLLSPGGVPVNLSSSGWRADTPVGLHLTPRGTSYNYGYFESKFIPDEANLPPTVSTFDFTTGANSGVENQGYRVYKRTGDLAVSSLNLREGGPNKLVIFVDGNLDINGKVLLDRGIDFLMFIVKGNINVDASVGDPAYISTATPGQEDLEGIYITNQQFITSRDPNSSRQLYVRGVVASFYLGTGQPVVFQRNLGVQNENYPAEIFEYAPDLMMLFPPFYSEKSILWREVAP